MAHTLEQFAKSCRSALKSEPGPAGRKKVCAILQEVLKDDEFIKTNFSDKTRFRGSSQHLKVTERFTRLDARTLRYQFTIEDPETWTRPWTAEYAWPLTDDLMYEYACHEGNYAMGNILRGARLKEKTEEAAKKSKQQ